MDLKQLKGDVRVLHFLQDLCSSFSGGVVGGGGGWWGVIEARPSAALSFRSHTTLSCKTAGLGFQKKREFIDAVIGAGVTFLSQSEFEIVAAALLCR